MSDDTAKDGEVLPPEKPSSNEIDLEKLKALAEAVGESWLQGHIKSQDEITKRMAMQYEQETKRLELQVHAGKSESNKRVWFGGFVVLIAAGFALGFLLSGRPDFAERLGYLVVGAGLGFIGNAQRR